MKRSKRGDAVLNTYQLHALRLNQLEDARLQHQLNCMNNNLQENLARLQRQAQYLRHHYTNHIRIVKLNQSYQPLNELYLYGIKQNQIKNYSGSIISLLLRWIF